VSAFIEVNVRRRFSQDFALDVGFSARSRALALFGPSGAGKSTVLAVVAGLVRPEQGHVRVEGTTWFDAAGRVDLPPRRRHVGYVVQDALLFPLLSVRHNLVFGAPASPRLDLDEVARLLEISHLLDRRPRHLSGGERQRVALGRAILSEPRLLLCDEPFATLDEARRDRLVDVLRRVREHLALPMVLVSHRADEVASLAEEVIHLEDGRVVSG